MDDDEQPKRYVLNLDEMVDDYEPTGDPLIDRGMEMSLGDVEAAAADPAHPDHEAAKAAQAYLAETAAKAVKSVYGDQFRRIGENIAAATRPNLSHLFSAPPLRARERPSLGDLLKDLTPRVPDVPQIDTPEWGIDETPQKTLDALLELSERMSEMVRIAAEHRTIAEEEAKASQAHSRRSLQLTWGALIGTWAAVIVAIAVAIAS
jgi:hypothetical protein